MLLKIGNLNQKIKMKNKMKVNPTSCVGDKYIEEDIHFYAINYLGSDKDEYVVCDNKLHGENYREGIMYQGDLIHCVSYYRHYLKHQLTLDYTKLPHIISKKNFDEQVRDFRKMDKKMKKRLEEKNE